MVDVENILEKLFGDSARARLLSIFVANPQEVFETKDLSTRVGMQAASFRSELKSLEDIGFIRRAFKYIPIEDTKGKIKKEKAEGYMLAKDFPYLKEVTQLFSSHTPLVRERLLVGIKGSGKVNLLVIAGALIGNTRDQVDMFIVGDAFKKQKIEALLKRVEYEIGQEIVYALMSTKEFNYRFGLFDRFLKNLFDNPHEVLVDKIGVPETKNSAVSQMRNMKSSGSDLESEYGPSSESVWDHIGLESEKKEPEPLSKED
ncbi:MAG: hypothetical protein O2794_02355 [bacterium]|nr:hypothetical protein [bacterium]